MTVPPTEDIPRQLAAATKAWASLRRLASYAAFDGWSLIVLGALNLICDGYGSVLGLLISFALLGAGIIEIRGVRQLRRLEPSAIIHMAYNQLALAGAVILYSIFSLFQNRHGSEVSNEISQALGSGIDANDTVVMAGEILYGGLIVLSLIFQGGTALFYFSRRKNLQKYLEQTPDWIQQMQKDSGEIAL